MKDKVVVIRLSSLGDVVLSTVIAEVLADNFDVFYITKEYFKPIFEGNPKVKGVFTIPSHPSVLDAVEVSFYVMREKPKFILDAHDKVLTSLIRRLIDPIGKKTYVWDAQRLKRRLAIFTQDLSDIKPVVSRFVQLAFSVYSSGHYSNYLPGPGQCFYPRVYPPAEPRSHDIYTFFKSLGDYIVIAPESSRATKNWDFLESLKLAREIERRGLTPVFVGKRLEHKNLFFPFPSFFNLDLTDLKYIVSRARAVVSVDSGIMHLATAMDVPTVAIFTSTVREMGFEPYGNGGIKILELNIGCRPCSLHGKNRCPRGHHICAKVPYSLVLEALFK